MVNFLKEYWFGFLLTLVSTVFLLFVAVVAAAPHDDQQMRGFSPCTYGLAFDLEKARFENKTGDALKAVAASYICYAQVMIDGFSQWLNGMQPRPWSTYWFEAETLEVPSEMSEPFSEDLLKANRLDDDGKSEDLWIENKESDNDTK